MHSIVLIKGQNRSHIMFKDPKEFYDLSVKAQKVAKEQQGEFDALMDSIEEICVKLSCLGVDGAMIMDDKTQISEGEVATICISALQRIMNIIRSEEFLSRIINGVTKSVKQKLK